MDTHPESFIEEIDAQEMELKDVSTVLGSMLDS